MWDDSEKAAECVADEPWEVLKCPATNSTALPLDRFSSGPLGTLPRAGRDRVRGSAMAVDHAPAPNPHPPPHPHPPITARVYVNTYFFSSLTIDRWRFLGGLLPLGWILSSLAEWLGVPVCHSNVQVQSVADPRRVVEFGFEGGPQAGRTGVYQCAPGMNPHLALTRQQRCYLGDARLTHAELVAIVDKLERAWTAGSYNLLDRNCNHFCDAFAAAALGPDAKLPGFINRGARLACWFPAPRLAPWIVKRWFGGGSWTAGTVCEMARAEALALEGGTSRREETFSKGRATLRDDAEERRGVPPRGPLAAHKTPVPLLGERRRGW